MISPLSLIHLSTDSTKLSLKSLPLGNIWFPLELTAWVRKRPDLKLWGSQLSTEPVFTMCNNPTNFI